jgi:hypothetical protein
MAGAGRKRTLVTSPLNWFSCKNLKRDNVMVIHALSPVGVGPGVL